MDYYGNPQQPLQQSHGGYLPNMSYYLNDGYNINQGGFANQMESMNGYPTAPIRMEPTIGAHHHQKRIISEMAEDNGNEDHGSKRQKTVNPFAPECSIPLPYQLGDEFGYYGPVSIVQRNKRERHRVRCVNDGYENLRSNLPFFDKDKRLSKVETLRLAIRYIGHLQELLINENHNETCQCKLDEPTETDTTNNADRKQRKRKQRSITDDSDSYEDGEF